MNSTIRQDRALVRLSLSNRRLTRSDLCQEWRQSTVQVWKCQHQQFEKDCYEVV